MGKRFKEKKEKKKKSFLNSFSKSKKALVLSFLIKLLLTIMIFSATFTIIGKIFQGITAQSDINYAEFLGDIQEIAGKSTGHRLSSLIIMDEGDAIVYFESNEKLKLEVQYPNIKTTRDIYFDRPSSCAEDVPCICWTDDFAYSNSEENPSELSVWMSSASCTKLDFQINLESCSLGSPRVEDGIQYECVEGFIIERNLLPTELESWYEDYAYLHNERRRSFTLERVESGVHITSTDVYVYEYIDDSSDYVDSGR